MSLDLVGNVTAKFQPQDSPLSLSRWIQKAVAGLSWRYHTATSSRLPQQRWQDLSMFRVPSCDWYAFFFAVLSSYIMLFALHRCLESHAIEDQSSSQLFSAPIPIDTPLRRLRRWFISFGAWILYTFPWDWEGESATSWAVKESWALSVSTWELDGVLVKIQEASLAAFLQLYLLLTAGNSWNSTLFFLFSFGFPHSYSRLWYLLSFNLG